MAYTLDEKNTERQFLLARILNPLTRPVLERANVRPGGRCLDLGCGQGNTTRMLWETLRPSECVGMDFDPTLLEHAAAHPDNAPGVTFLQGDATKLSFADASFDIVFCRYLLVHLPNPISVIREMLRVAGPNGKVIVYEPDCAVQMSYPPSWALEKMGSIWDGLFPDSTIGRKLYSHFQSAGASRIDAGAVQHSETGSSDVRRVYRLSMYAAEGPIKARGLLSDGQFEDLVQELERLEQEPHAACFKFPDMWVIASL
ncbi:MAG: methyltransferase domain-containing protein [Acidobacteria bacterium]|nr:methyltransferase domain-containing protein [Acidobacteriota bacterium]